MPLYLNSTVISLTKVCLDWELQLSTFCHKQWVGFLNTVSIIKLANPKKISYFNRTDNGSQTRKCEVSNDPDPQNKFLGFIHKSK